MKIVMTFIIALLYFFGVALINVYLQAYFSSPFVEKYESVDKYYIIKDALQVASVAINGFFAALALRWLLQERALVGAFFVAILPLSYSMISLLQVNFSFDYSGFATIKDAVVFTASPMVFSILISKFRHKIFKQQGK
ncbi:MAG: hypothetical protein Q7J29_02860 [Stagnimonas sp.]|nr:hypothetical protein [Stagnimonas sp.]